MQIVDRWINRIKNNKQLFYHCASLVYKFFNVIERNDTVRIKGDSKVYRILDIYSDNTVDILCDEDPNPIREKRSQNQMILLYKFFKNKEHLRNRAHDKGWRLFGGGFVNVHTKEVLERKSS